MWFNRNRGLITTQEVTVPSQFDKKWLKHFYLRITNELQHVNNWWGRGAVSTLNVNPGFHFLALDDGAIFWCEFI